MARTRQQNVTAAQWTANGAALGAPDLTEPGSYPFGENVFNLAVQKERLPKDVFKQLQATLDRGEALDPSLADAVAKEMREWAMEHGATHFTHWFQPLTNSTAEKHDSFYEPAGDGTAIAGFSGKELIQGEPDASSFPTGGVRATFEARGYTAWDPTSPAFIIENPNGALLCIPTAFASWTGEALDTKIPLLRSMDALSTSAIRALKLLGDDDRHAASSPRSGPSRSTSSSTSSTTSSAPTSTPPAARCSGPSRPRATSSTTTTSARSPSASSRACSRPSSELAKLGVPTKTRHNEVAPNQYELAPIFENSNVGADHQQLTMQIMQNVARRYGLVCLLHEKPYAGVNGSGKHNNWSMGTDSGLNLLEPGDTPHENISFLFFCAAVIAAVNRHQALLRASVAGIGQDHRLGANEAPPAIISIFLGAELRKVFETIEARRGRPGDAGLVPGPGHAGAAAAADARRRSQPDLAVRLHRQQVRVPRPRLQPVARAAQHGPQHDRGRGHRGAQRQARGRRRRRARTSTTAVVDIVRETYSRQQAGLLRRRQLRRGVARRGREARPGQPAHDARRAAVAGREADDRHLRALQGALRARARVALRGHGRAVHDAR